MLPSRTKALQFSSSESVCRTAACRAAMAWCSLLLACPGVGSAYAAGPLRIEVLRGDGANNNPTAGTATSPIVRIMDAEGHPVAKALVVFSPPPAGPSVAFAGLQAEATALTDDSGIAAAPRTRATGANGPFEVRVMATYAGLSATAAIRQINLGLRAMTDDEQELTVIQLPAPAPSSRKRVREKSLLVRVEDGKGRPTASAKVLFVLRRAASGNEPHDIASEMATSTANGEAGATLPAPTGSHALEFMVRADFNGRRATRFFPVTQ